MESISSVVITAIISVIGTLATLWIKGSLKKEERDFEREDSFIEDLREAIKKLQNTVADQDKEIRAIRVELKNRDAEYVKLFQDHATLKARYEVLSADHDLLKKQYDSTVQELTKFKSDIKEKTKLAANEIKKI